MLKHVVTSALVAFGLPLAPAMAADLDAFYGQPQDTDGLPPPDLTFGTGWYLRGDAAASDDAKPRVLGALDTASSRPRDWNYAVGGGVGYKFNSFFRSDLTGDYMGTQKTVEAVYAPGVSTAFKSNLRRFDVLANGYLDLGTWGGLTPYIGAGVGFAGIRLDGSYELDAPATGTYVYTKVPGKTRYDLAWAAMAGVSYNVTPSLLIDVGYRYLDLGTYTIPRFVSSPFNVGTKTDLTSHQIRAGLRYMIY